MGLISLDVVGCGWMGLTSLDVVGCVLARMCHLPSGTFICIFSIPLSSTLGGVGSVGEAEEVGCLPLSGVDGSCVII